MADLPAASAMSATATVAASLKTQCKSASAIVANSIVTATPSLVSQAVAIKQATLKTPPPQNTAKQQTEITIKPTIATAASRTAVASITPSIKMTVTATKTTVANVTTTATPRR